MLNKCTQNVFLFMICDIFDIKYISLLSVSFQFFLKEILRPKSILIIATIGEPIYKIHQVHNSSNSIPVVIQVSISCSKSWNVGNKQFSYYTEISNTIGLQSCNAYPT